LGGKKPGASGANIRSGCLTPSDFFPKVFKSFNVLSMRRRSGTSNPSSVPLHFFLSGPSLRHGEKYPGFGPFSRALNFVLSRHSKRREIRSEEHTSELQSLRHLVCRLLLEKKKKKHIKKQ